MKKIDMLLEKVGKVLVYLVPLTLFVYSSQFLFPEITLKTFVFYGVIGLLALVVAATYLRRGVTTLNFNTLHKALLVFILILTITAAVGIDPFQSFFGTAERGLGVITWWALYIYICALQLFLPREKIRFFLSYQLIIGAVMAMLALVQRFFGSPEGDGFFLVVAGSGSRTGGTLGNPTYLAGYLLPLLFLGYSYVVSRWRENIKKNIWVIATTILVLFGFIGANTRGALIGLLVAATYLGYGTIAQRVKEGRMKRQAVYGLLGLILIVGSLFVATRQASFWQSVPLLNRLARISLNDVSTINRLIGWRVALRGFADHPLTGVGYENYGFLADRDYDPRQLRGGSSETFFDKPHNAVLEIATTTGIIGLVAYGWLLLSLWRAIGSISSTHTRRLGRAALIAYITQSLFLFDTFGTLLLVMTSIGVLLALNTDIKTKESSSRLVGVSLRYAGAVLLSGGAVFLLAFSWYGIVGASRHFTMYRDFKLDEADSAFLAYTSAWQTPLYPFKIKVTRDALESVAEQSQLLPVPTVIRILDPLFADTEAVLKKNPENYPLLIAFAQTKIITSRFKKTYLEGVEDLVARAIALSPARQQNYYMLANVRLAKNDTQGAQSAAQQAIDLDPSAGDPYFQAALIAFRIEGKDKALPLFIKAVEHGYRGEDAEEAQMLGDFLGDAEYYDLSYEAYQQAYRFTGNTEELKMKMGLVSYYGGHHERAKKHFEEFIALYPGSLNDSPNLPVFQQIFNELGVEGL